MNTYLIIILIFYLGAYFLDIISNQLNLRSIEERIPTEFQDVYDTQKYKESQNYLKENTRFSLIHSTYTTCLLVPFIVLGGFNLVDVWIRSFSNQSIVLGLLFFGVISVGASLLDFPFTIYHTFILEKKYGFNKTTIKTFITDRVKMIVLSILIGGPVLGGILWFFETFGKSAWVWCWAALSIFQVLMLWIVPAFIMPLFNKFEPLEEGDLKSEIEKYANHENFKLQGIYKMDGSKRSTKSNAFFTGIGSKRRVVLFDTLIEKHTISELVGVLAHEIGHFKRKHIYKMYGISMASIGLMFWVLSLFLNNSGLFEAFKMEHVSVYGSLVFFAFLYSPIELMLGVGSHWLSRKHEYEADEFAVKTTHDPQSFTNALKKLSVDNLSNLTPHPFKVFIEYSHPTVLNRVKAIKEIKLS